MGSGVRVFGGLIMRWVVCGGWCLAGCMGVGVDEVWIRWVPILPHAKCCAFTESFSSLVGVYDIYGCGSGCLLIPPCVYMCCHL